MDENENRGIPNIVESLWSTTLATETVAAAAHSHASQRRATTGLQRDSRSFSIMCAAVLFVELQKTVFNDARQQKRQRG